MVQIRKSIQINKSADHLWDVLANGFENVGEWATPIAASRSNLQAGSPLPGASTAGRACDTSFGPLTETITAFDEDQRSFTYIADSGLPGFVREGGNTWKVTPLGANKAEVSMDLKMDLKGLGKVMTPMMKVSLRKQAGQILDDLKVYAETGKVSDRKRKALAKAK